MGRKLWTLRVSGTFYQQAGVNVHGDNLSLISALTVLQHLVEDVEPQQKEMQSARSLLSS